MAQFYFLHSTDSDYTFSKNWQVHFALNYTDNMKSRPCLNYLIPLTVLLPCNITFLDLLHNNPLITIPKPRKLQNPHFPKFGAKNNLAITPDLNSCEAIYSLS